MKRLAVFVIALSAIFLSGCGTTTTQGSETKAEVCRQIGAKLPTRSRADTKQTKNEIQGQYAAFSLICPEWEHLIPE